MATPAQIILILACVCLADCRLRGRFNKPLTSPTEHDKIQEGNSNSFADQVDPKIKTNADVVEANISRRFRGESNKQLTSPTEHKQIQKANSNSFAEHQDDPKIKTNADVVKANISRGLRGESNKQLTSPTEHKQIQEANSHSFAEHQDDPKIKTNADVVKANISRGLRGESNKQLTSPTEHKQIQEANSHSFGEHPMDPKINASVVPDAIISRDEDVIVFPKDEDTKVYLDVNKVIKEVPNTTDNNCNDAVSTTYVPLLPKVIAVVEATEAFTNPIISKDEEKYETKYYMENIQSQTPIQELNEAAVINDVIIKENSNITLDSNVTASMSNDTNSNETVPNFSSRFGVTGIYVLVPANNVQTYQAVQVPNAVHGNLQQYGTYTGQGNTPLTKNGAYSQYTPNANSQFPQNANVVQNEPATSNRPVAFNGVQGPNNVPITVGNTYMINGQLYAAVTVPNNVNVPSSVYLINSQTPQAGHQVNNSPGYNLALVGQGVQGNNLNMFQ